MNPFDLALNPPTEPPPNPNDTGPGGRPNPFDVALAPAQTYVPKLLADRQREGKGWDDVAGEVKGLGVDPEAVRQDYQLGEARRRQAGEGIGVGEAFVRNSLPFGDSLGVKGNVQYGEARKRIEERTATPADLETVARYERLEEIEQEQQKTFGGKAVAALAGVPKIVGEFAGAGKVIGLGGKALGLGQAGAAVAAPSLGRAALNYGARGAAITPLVPSMYVEAAQKKNLEEGRQANDVKGYAPALGLGYANVLVLGSMQRLATNPAGVVGKLATRTGTGAVGRAGAAGAIGVAEQAGVDVAAGRVDEFLPKAYRTGTKYGVIGNFARGEFGEGAQHAAIQLMTFAGFAAMHNRAPERLTDAWTQAVDAAAKKGAPADQAAQAAARPLAAMAEALKANPDLTAPEAKRLFEGEKDPAAKKLGEAAAEALPTAREDGDPPVAAGHTRFYHGGEMGGGAGSRFFTPDRTYAEGYASKSVIPDAGVSYVDLPNDHPLLKKAYDDTGTSSPAPFVHFDAPEGIAKTRKPVSRQPVKETGRADPAAPPEQKRQNGVYAPDPLDVLPPERLREWARDNGFPARGGPDAILRKIADSPSAWARLRAEADRRVAPPAEIAPVAPEPPKSAEPTVTPPVAEIAPPGANAAGDRRAAGRGTADRRGTGDPSTFAGKERRRFQSQEELTLDRLVASGKPREVLEALRAEGELFAPDALTGFTDAQKGTARPDTVTRAAEHAEATGEPAVYAEIDIKNLGGLNSKLGATGANEQYRAMTDIVKGELEKIGADVSLFRHGGDEFSAVVVNADPAKVGAALERAEALVQEHVKRVGLHEIEHPKHKGDAARRGTGITFGVSQIEPGLKPTEVFSRADKEVERRKKVGNVAGIPAEAPRVVPPEGQARGVAEGPGGADQGGRQAAGAGAEVPQEAAAPEVTAPRLAPPPRTMTPGQLRMEAIRAKQRGLDPVAAPPTNAAVTRPVKAAGRMTATELAAELKEVADRDFFHEGDPLDFLVDEPTHQAAAVELSAVEAHVLAEREKGRSFGDIAKDPQFTKADGTQMSRQAVAGVEARVQKKRGAAGSIAKTDHAEVALDRAFDLVAKGGRLQVGDLTFDPTEVALKAKERLSKEELNHELITRGMLGEAKDVKRIAKQLGLGDAEVRRRIAEAVRAGRVEADQREAAGKPAGVPGRAENPPQGRPEDGREAAPAPEVAAAPPEPPAVKPPAKRAKKADPKAGGKAAAVREGMAAAAKSSAVATPPPAPAAKKAGGKKAKPDPVWEPMDDRLPEGEADVTEDGYWRGVYDSAETMALMDLGMTPEYRKPGAEPGDAAGPPRTREQALAEFEAEKAADLAKFAARDAAAEWVKVTMAGGGRSALAPFEAKLKAAGATPVGKVGEVVRYDPGQHDLRSGGGTMTRAVMTRRGWKAADGTVLVKPEVRRHAMQDELGHDRVAEADQAAADYRRANETPAERSARVEAEAREAERDVSGEEFALPGEAETEVAPGVHFAAFAPPIQFTFLNGLLGKGTGIGKALGRWFTSKGGLPAEAFEEKVRKDGRVGAYIQDVLATERDLRKALGPYDRIDAARLKLMNAALGGDQAAFARIPPEVGDVIRSMRHQIDALSTALVQSGAIDAKLVGAVDANLGSYMTRQYRVFSDPKWRGKVDPAVVNRFKTWLEAELRAAGENPTAEEIAGQTEKLLYDGTAAENPIAFLAKSKLGSKNLSILTKRKDVPAELRALWGEIEDPLVNYANSVGKMSHLLANHQFLAAVKQRGLGTFLSEKPTTELKAPIATEGSEAMNPLNGLHTTPEIKQAFEDVFSKSSSSGIAKAYMTMVGFSKYAKTVGSHVTHIRNLVGNVGFAVANGHFRVGKMNDAVRALRDDTAAGRAYWRELTERGVVGEGVHANEFRQIVDEVFNARETTAAEAMGWVSDRRIARWVKKGAALATKAYSAEDAVWKVYAFENEVARYTKAMPGWTAEEVRSHAADVVRNTYPTYSLIPAAVKSLRRVPFGPFVSFPSEVVRTTVNTLRLARKEMNDPATRSIGATRLAGTVAAVGGALTVSAVSRAINGMDADDEKAMRRFLPEWSKDSPLLHLGHNAKGERVYLDMGSTDPHSYLMDPVIAAVRGDDPSESAVNALKSAARPFTTEDLVGGKVMDVARNKTQRGQPVYNEAATALDRAKAVGKHVGQAFVPGSVDQGMRLSDAAHGKPDPKTGKVGDVRTEVVANTFGQRVQGLDLNRSVEGKAREFTARERDAGKMLADVATGKGVVSDADLVGGYQKSEAARRRVFEELRKDVLAAEKLGMGRPALIKALKGAGLGAEDVGAVLAGRYRPAVVSGDTFKGLPPAEARRRLGVILAARK